MNRSVMISGLILACLSAGCLSVEEIESVIELQNNTEPISVKVIYRDISSDAASEEELADDFDSLIDTWRRDNHLIERMEDGFYVKDRDVRIENGRINGYEDGIVRDLGSVNCYLCKPGTSVIAGTVVPPDTRIVMNLDEDEGFEVAETNGQVIGTGENQKIIWGDQVEELRYVVRATGEKATVEKNRPKMIELLEKYIEQERQEKSK
jgi:hypothetical protein